MKASTVQALDRINRRFYSAGASEFHQSRSGPWKGWSKVVHALKIMPNMTRFRVLDVGCGNGRFSSFLVRSLPGVALEYVGIDSSHELLASARQDLKSEGKRVHLRQVNLMGDNYQGCPPLAEVDSSFDLVVAFGLLHHIPQRLQHALLRRCLEACKPGGTVCASFWQFGSLERFHRRKLPWSWAVQRQLLKQSQIDELDEYDWLLPWGQKRLDNEQDLVRYCRFNTPISVASLLGAVAPAVSAQQFNADGATNTLNLYTLLTKAD